MSVSDAEWWAEAAETAYKSGRHRPASWRVEYEDNADGCLPRGWYAVGLAANGFPIDWPIRHEYGPFATEIEAESHAAAVDKAMEDLENDTGRNP